MVKREAKLTSQRETCEAADRLERLYSAAEGICDGWIVDLFDDKEINPRACVRRGMMFAGRCMR